MRWIGSPACLLPGSLVPTAPHLPTPAGTACAHIQLASTVGLPLVLLVCAREVGCVFCDGRVGAHVIYHLLVTPAAPARTVACPGPCDAVSGHIHCNGWPGPAGCEEQYPRAPYMRPLAGRTPRACGPDRAGGDNKTSIQQASAPAVAWPAPVVLQQAARTTCPPLPPLPPPTTTTKTSWHKWGRGTCLSVAGACSEHPVPVGSCCNPCSQHHQRQSLASLGGVLLPFVCCGCPFQYEHSLMTALAPMIHQAVIRSLAGRCHGLLLTLQVNPSLLLSTQMPDMLASPPTLILTALTAPTGSDGPHRPPQHPH